MTRSVRQSKILDIISAYEIETQEDLVNQLRAANFDVTQATISRDIKELGLIKILSAESNKYKYAVVDASEKQTSNKYLYLFKEAIISIKQAQYFVVIRTLKGMAAAIAAMLDKFNLENLMGATFGDDTVMAIFPDATDSIRALSKLTDLFNS